MSKKEGYTFYFPAVDISMKPIEPVTGELAIVNLHVNVVFEWSNEIVVDIDDDGNPTEYKSGWLMKVLPQTVVYNGEKRITVAHTMKEK
jgi:hypothetical protein